MAVLLMLLYCSSVNLEGALTERQSIAEVAGVTADPNSDYGIIVLYSAEHDRMHIDPAVARRLDNPTEFYFAQFEEIKVPWSTFRHFIAVFPRLSSGNYEVGEYEEDSAGAAYIWGQKLITVYPGIVSETKHIHSDYVPWE